MNNKSLIDQCIAGLKANSLNKEASANTQTVQSKLEAKLESLLQQKEARSGNPANVALAMKCRPGLFPGLRDTPVVMDDPKGLLDGITFDPNTVANLRLRAN